MKIRVIQLPSSLPTVVHDPGLWFGHLCASQDLDCAYVSLNYDWWQVLCSQRLEAVLLKGLPAAFKFRKKLEWMSTGIRPATSGKAAQKALAAFRHLKTYSDKQTYRQHTDALQNHLNCLNRVQREIHFSHYGPELRTTEYAQFSDMRAKAQDARVLRLSIEEVITPDLQTSDVIFLQITNPKDLLTGIIVSNLVRAANPKAYIAIFDHGYENFSLMPYLEKIKENKDFWNTFDCLVLDKQNKDAALLDLVEELKGGARPNGIYERTSAQVREPVANLMPLETIPSFTPEPIVWTRVSDQKCYWSKCTFCTQNAKFLSEGATSKSEIEQTVDYLQMLSQRGIRNFIFSDEALHPMVLKTFASLLKKRDLGISWSCRSRLEQGFTQELFDLMKASGCYEVLFGLESIVTRIQVLMDKRPVGKGDESVRAILENAAEAGVSVHLSTIAGFPGERADELKQTVDFLIESSLDFPSTTYTINKFALFPDTPISFAPEAFGLELQDEERDVSGPLAFDRIDVAAAADEVTDEEIAAEQDRAFLAIESQHFDTTDELANNLYQRSGQGAVFKTLTDNALSFVKLR